MEPNRFQSSISTSRQSTKIDAGLRQHFVRVYNTMAAGLVVTGLVAWFSAQSEAMVNALVSLHSNPLLGFLVMFSPMIIVMLAFNPATMRRLSSAALTGIFLAFSGYFGWLLSTIFLIYTAESIAQVFFITSATFLAMSIWGQTTKKDLSGLGSFLMMGMIGLVIAIVVNMFMQSSTMMFFISGAGVVIYTLMTAYDTQMIKQYYHESNGNEANAKMAVMGALSLYINFIMLFQFLMQFLGQER